MCMHCWHAAGKPFEITAAVRRFAPLAAKLNDAGKLHAVLDDWNLDDEYITREICSADDSIEIALLQGMLNMTEAERWATVIYSEYVKP